jgi:hypothetical protein
MWLHVHAALYLPVSRTSSGGRGAAATDAPRAVPAWAGAGQHSSRCRATSPDPRATGVINFITRPLTTEAKVAQTAACQHSTAHTARRLPPVFRCRTHNRLLQRAW